MNREIKFKAYWYKLECRVTEIQWDNDGKIKRIKVANSEKWLYPNSRIIVAEYIGLKDKKDKDIHDGDVLIWLDSYGKERKHQVKWSEKWACWDLPMWSSDSGRGFYSFEIIGNVYENPELLKEV